jgi:hypothetical protein
MKSKVFSKKLTLNKKTIADLTIGKMMNVHGGGPITARPVITDTCATSCACTGPTGYIYCPPCKTC